MTRLVALAALVLGVVACGAAGTGSSQTPSASSAATTPAGVTFKLNPVGIGVTATGTITVTTQGNSLSVELKITGLQAKSSHISHIHVGSCQARGSIKFALKQVVADGQGVADTKTTLNATYPPTGSTWYVVVHAGADMQGTNSQYLLCGNLFK